MKVQQYICTLKSPVVLFGSAKTEANVDNLYYIPGSVFRGVVAGSLYQTLIDEKEKTEVLNIFHDGTVQFSDAHLAIDGQRSWALPALCYVEKGKEPKNGVFLHHQLAEEQRKKKLKQLRNRFFVKENEQIKLVTPNFGTQIKSAWDRNRWSSQDSMMYLYQFLEAGQEFHFEVRSTKESYFDKISEILEGDQYIGKSRSAEYGAVHIEPKSEPQEIEAGQVQGGEVLVYAESNLCFVDQYGEPTWQPAIQQLGFRSGTINYKKSQLWLDRYTPWNGHRKTHDPERLIIKKGSVFVIEDANKFDADTVKIGVGHYLSEGLGRVLYNPDFISDLGTMHYEEKSVEHKPRTVENINNHKDNTWLEALSEQKQLVNTDYTIDKLVNDFIKTELSRYRGVSASQWGGIYALARVAKNDADLKNLLFNESDKTGFLRRGKMKEIWARKQRAENLKTFLSPFTDNSNYKRRLLIRLAREIAKKKDQ